MSNAKIKAAIADVAPALELLLAVRAALRAVPASPHSLLQAGFEKQTEFLVLPAQADLQRVKEAADALQRPPAQSGGATSTSGQYMLSRELQACSMRELSNQRALLNHLLT